MPPTSKALREYRPSSETRCRTVTARPARSGVPLRQLRPRITPLMRTRSSASLHVDVEIVRQSTSVDIVTSRQSGTVAALLEDPGTVEVCGLESVEGWRRSARCEAEPTD